MPTYNKLTPDEVSARLSLRGFKLISPFARTNCPITIQCITCSTFAVQSATHAMRAYSCQVCEPPQLPKATAPLVQHRITPLPSKPVIITVKPTIGINLDTINSTSIPVPDTTTTKPHGTDRNRVQLSKLSHRVSRDHRTYFYVYAIGGRYCGYGITDDISLRHATHSKNFDLAGVEFKMLRLYRCTREMGLDIERALKRVFNHNGCTIAGFKTESTNIHNSKAVVNFIEYYLTGGKIIKTKEQK